MDCQTFHRTKHHFQGWLNSAHLVSRHAINCIFAPIYCSEFWGCLKGELSRALHAITTNWPLPLIESTQCTLSSGVATSISCANYCPTWLQFYSSRLFFLFYSLHFRWIWKADWQFDSNKHRKDSMRATSSTSHCTQSQKQIRAWIKVTREITNFCNSLPSGKKAFSSEA